MTSSQAETDPVADGSFNTGSSPRPTRGFVPVWTYTLKHRVHQTQENEHVG